MSPATRPASSPPTGSARPPPPPTRSPRAPPQARLVVTAGVRQAVAVAHAVVLETLRSGSPAYGVNTGLGAARDQLVPEELLLAFQEHVITSPRPRIGAA